MLEILDLQGQEHPQGQEAHRGQTGFLEVLERALDKGLVIAGWRSVRVLGIELLTLDIGAVVASCATYLAIAEAIEETADRSGTGDGELEIVPR